MPALPRSTPFDRRLRRLRRDRAARSKSPDAFLLERASVELLDRLDAVERRFTDALMIGGLERTMSEGLRAKGVRVFEADPGAYAARAAGGVQCDEDFLPFADESFDLVVAIGSLDTVNDLPGALTLIRKCLRPGGLFLAALLGAGSVPLLRNSLRKAEESENRAAAARIHPQIDVRAGGDLLARAGFELPVVDRDVVTVRYRQLGQLIRDLRRMAATATLEPRTRSPLQKGTVAAAEHAFAEMSDDQGKASETFELLFLSGWKAGPSPTQVPGEAR